MLYGGDYTEGVDDYCMTMAKAVDIIVNTPAVPFVITVKNRQTPLGVVRSIRPELLWKEYVVIMRTKNQAPRWEVKISHERAREALSIAGGEAWDEATRAGEGLIRVVGSGINTRGLAEAVMVLEQCAESLGIADEHSRSQYKKRKARMELLLGRVGKFRWKVSVLFPDAPIVPGEYGYNRVDAICPIPSQALVRAMELVEYRVSRSLYR